ncbi:alpha/beta fold hydrolase [Leifsonia poae]|uniref:alpha/beta fold hydrolase n=1 Tax=Leifsonia poae TaxID=110933 RepID=UPI001CBC5D43|nr:alpha/beta fold hydrolase [Leifsonia poae]
MTRPALATRTAGHNGVDAAHPLVVLLHGFAASGSADYEATGWPRSLAAAGRRTLVVDLPGHGGSPAIETAAAGTTTTVVTAILAAIEAAEPAGPVDVIGYSLGARLAWELPAASAGRVRRLVLGGLSPFEPFTAVDIPALRAALAGGDTPADPLTGLMTGMLRTPGLDSASLANLMEGLGSEPFTPAANPPAVPTLLVAGADDRMTEGIDALAADLPLVELLRVPGDHRGTLDSAGFRAAALAFLARP